ncbi:hypothetical protein [Streptomyces sp. NPDC101115]|uniref:hypothetical protein n=1 Tax=Streptomyces sp. NPDC101115 TaxID=3366106 RepID=UPI00380AFB88
MTPVLPKRPGAERRERLVELLAAMAATGLTGAHVMDLGGHGVVPGLLAAIEAHGDLPLRLRLAPWCMPGATTEALDEFVRLQERAGRAWRCRDLRDAGATLALGSDWPIAHDDARQVLATARPPAAPPRPDRDRPV